MVNKTQLYINTYDELKVSGLDILNLKKNAYRILLKRGDSLYIISSTYFDHLKFIIAILPYHISVHCSFFFFFSSCKVYYNQLIHLTIPLLMDV